MSTSNSNITAGTTTINDSTADDSTSRSSTSSHGTSSIFSGIKSKWSSSSFTKSVKRLSSTISLSHKNSGSLLDENLNSKASQDLWEEYIESANEESLSKQLQKLRNRNSLRDSDDCGDQGGHRMSGGFGGDDNDSPINAKIKNMKQKEQSFNIDNDDDVLQDDGPDSDDAKTVYKDATEEFLFGPNGILTERDEITGRKLYIVNKKGDILIPELLKYHPEKGRLGDLHPNGFPMSNYNGGMDSPLESDPDSLPPRQGSNFYQPSAGLVSQSIKKQAMDNFEKNGQMKETETTRKKSVQIFMQEKEEEKREKITKEEEKIKKMLRIKRADSNLSSLSQSMLESEKNSLNIDIETGEIDDISRGESKDGTNGSSADNQENRILSKASKLSLSTGSQDSQLDNTSGSKDKDQPIFAILSKNSAGSVASLSSLTGENVNSSDGSENEATDDENNSGVKVGHLAPLPAQTINNFVKTYYDVVPSIAEKIHLNTEFMGLAPPLAEDQFKTRFKSGESSDEGENDNKTKYPNLSPPHNNMANNYSLSLSPSSNNSNSPSKLTPTERLNTLASGASCRNQIRRITNIPEIHSVHFWLRCSVFYTPSDEKVIKLLEKFVSYAAEASGLETAQPGRMMLTVPAEKVLASRRRTTEIQQNIRSQQQQNVQGGGSGGPTGDGRKKISTTVAQQQDRSGNRDSQNQQQIPIHATNSDGSTPTPQPLRLSYSSQITSNKDSQPGQYQGGDGSHRGSTGAVLGCGGEYDSQNEGPGSPGDNSNTQQTILNNQNTIAVQQAKQDIATDSQSETESVSNDMQSAMNRVTVNSGLVQAVQQSQGPIIGPKDTIIEMNNNNNQSPSPGSPKRRGSIYRLDRRANTFDASAAKADRDKVISSLKLEQTPQTGLSNSTTTGGPNSTTATSSQTPSAGARRRSKDESVIMDSLNYYQTQSISEENEEHHGLAIKGLYMNQKQSKSFTQSEQSQGSSNEQLSQKSHSNIRRSASSMSMKAQGATRLVSTEAMPDQLSIISRQISTASLYTTITTSSLSSEDADSNNSPGGESSGKGSGGQGQKVVQKGESGTKDSMSLKKGGSNTNLRSNTLQSPGGPGSSTNSLNVTAVLMASASSGQLGLGSEKISQSQSANGPNSNRENLNQNRLHFRARTIEDIASGITGSKQDRLEALLSESSGPEGAKYSHGISKLSQSPEQQQQMSSGSLKDQVKKQQEFQNLIDAINNKDPQYASEYGHGHGDRDVDQNLGNTNRSSNQLGGSIDGSFNTGKNNSLILKQQYQSQSSKQGSQILMSQSQQNSSLTLGHSNSQIISVQEFGREMGTIQNNSTDNSLSPDARGSISSDNSTNFNLNEVSVSPQGSIGSPVSHHGHGRGVSSSVSAAIKSTLGPSRSGSGLTASNWFGNLLSPIFGGPQQSSGQQHGDQQSDKSPGSGEGPGRSKTMNEVLLNSTHLETNQQNQSQQSGLSPNNNNTIRNNSKSMTTPGTLNLSLTPTAISRDISPHDIQSSPRDHDLYQPGPIQSSQQFLQVVNVSNNPNKLNNNFNSGHATTNSIGLGSQIQNEMSPPGPGGGFQNGVTGLSETGQIIKRDSFQRPTALLQKLNLPKWVPVDNKMIHDSDSDRSDLDNSDFENNMNNQQRLSGYHNPGGGYGQQQYGSNHNLLHPIHPIHGLRGNLSMNLTREQRREQRRQKRRREQLVISLGCRLCSLMDDMVDENSDFFVFLYLEPGEGTRNSITYWLPSVVWKRGRECDCVYCITTETLAEEARDACTRFLPKTKVITLGSAQSLRSKSSKERANNQQQPGQPQALMNQVQQEQNNISPVDVNENKTISQQNQQSQNKRSLNPLAQLANPSNSLNYNMNQLVRLTSKMSGFSTNTDTHAGTQTPQIAAAAQSGQMNIQRQNSQTLSLISSGGNSLIQQNSNMNLLNVPPPPVSIANKEDELYLIFQSILVEQILSAQEQAAADLENELNSSIQDLDNVGNSLIGNDSKNGDINSSSKGGTSLRSKVQGFNNKLTNLVSKKMNFPKMGANLFLRKADVVASSANEDEEVEGENNTNVKKASSSSSSKTKKNNRNTNRKNLKGNNTGSSSSCVRALCCGNSGSTESPTSKKYESNDEEGQGEETDPLKID